MTVGELCTELEKVKDQETQIDVHIDVSAWWLKLEPKRLGRVAYIEKIGARVVLRVGE